MLVCSIGEVLWDVFPEGEYLGGAPLNVAVNLHRLGADVTLISGLGRDERGMRALAAIESMGLATVGISINDLPTGVAKVEWKVEKGDQQFVIPRPAAFDLLECGSTMAIEPAIKEADWIYVGSLAQTDPAAEQFTAELVARATAARVFYDVNLRDGHWNVDLVKRLSSLASVVKMNEAEARQLSLLTSAVTPFSLVGFSEYWTEKHRVDVLCITLGQHGAFLFSKGCALQVPGFAVEITDTVGAGDAFAAAFLFAYHLGWTLSEAACFGNALGAYVASHAGAVPPWTLDEVIFQLPEDSPIASRLAHWDLLPESRAR